MIQYSSALEQILKRAYQRGLESEWVELASLEGRVLACDVHGAEDIPHWDNSAMDGFAVQAGWCEAADSEQPVRLPVVDFIAAGDSGNITHSLPDAPVAVEIMTGAPLPVGPWDSVIKIEEVKLERNAEGRTVAIQISAPIDQGQNVRYRGEDFRQGALVAVKGTVVTPDLLLAFATLGIARAKVIKRPRVCLISTGRELVGPEVETLAPGMIRNSTATYLRAVLPGLGVDLIHHATLADDSAVFEKHVEDLLKLSPDLILTTGAVSMGKHDFIRESLLRLGAKTHFHKMAIRPGKPLLFCEFEEGPVVFGVPGNPISTAVGLRFFVEPFLRACQGLKPEPEAWAKLAFRFKKPPGLRCFFKAQVKGTHQGLSVTALSGQGSALIQPLLHSNAWVELPEDGDAVEAGAWVRVHPLFSQEKAWAFERGETLGALEFSHATAGAQSELSDVSPAVGTRCC